MKKEYAWAYISILSMIIFLIMTYFMLAKVNMRVENIESGVLPVTIVTTKGNENMNINYKDLLSNEDKVIGLSSVNVLINFNNVTSSYEFDLVMHNNSPYSKTENVDGINIKEYTYEIKCNDNIIVPETEINSYEEDSDITLIHQKIFSTTLEYNYEIIFKFYSNKYDQSHLSGLKLNSNLLIKTT